jgi:hypothetical protein
MVSAMTMSSRVVAAALLVIGSTTGMAQLRAPQHGDLDLYAAAPYATQREAAGAQEREQQPQPRFAPETLGYRNAALITGSVVAMAAYGKAKWWEDGFSGRFRTTNEGWFGQDTYAGGADKLGHAFFAYVGTRLLTRGFEFIGNEPQPALNYGFWTSLGLMTAVEVVDGYSKRYRFSPQDAVMNVVGAGAGYLLERHPDLDRLLDLRLHYKPSADSGFDPGGDYSGQTYLLAIKASGIAALRTHEPLRYLELAIGYGSRGYENPFPPFEHKRNLYFGVALNVSELLRQTVYRAHREPGFAQKGTEMFLEYIQIPGTVVSTRHRL